MIGRTLDHYRIVERIGAGGMGVVYRAVDERLKRDVAVKVLPAGALDDEQARRRFHQEALTLSKLNHPHIATIYDFYSQEGTDYLVMEYIKGPTLGELLQEGLLPELEVLRLGGQIVEALVEAHDHGIVHRDLKPSNIIVTVKGRIKVLDFGLAKLLEPIGEDAPTLERTEKGIARGTIPYMSPEQLLGEPVGPASDIYSAGAVLYEMATGRRPHAELQGPRLIDAILNKEPEVPSSLRPDIRKELEKTILKALRKDPSERIQNASELKNELERISLSLSHPTATPRPSLPKRWLVAFAALIAVTFFLLGVWDFRSAPNDEVAGMAADASPVIAVLPFMNLSGDPSIDHLGIGIAHSLITSLASIPTITIVSPSATLGYESERPDPDQIARDHGATFVVTRAVQRAGERLQVTANLVKPDHSIVWGGTSEGSLDDLFALQHSLAVSLSAVLQPSLPEAARVGLTTLPTENTAAFGDYTQAYAFLERPDVTGNVDRAIKLFEAAIDKDPDLAAAQAGLGEAYWAKYKRSSDVGFTEDARDATMEALRLDPEDARVRFTLAVIYEDTGRSEAAIDELYHSLELSSNNDDAHRLLAKILAAGGDLDAAIVEFENAIRIRPNFWGNHRALGMAFFRAGELDRAALAFTRVTELQPDAAAGFQALGAAYHVAGNVERAVEKYERAIEVGASPAVYSNLSTIHYRRGNFEAAVRQYERAIDLEPSPLRHRNLGDALKRLGQEEHARASFERAKQMAEERLEVNPKDADTMGALAVYEAKLEQSDTAKAHADAAVSLAPTDGHVLFYQAVVHALTGEPSNSLRYLSGGDREWLQPVRGRPGRRSRKLEKARGI